HTLLRVHRIFASRNTWRSVSRPALGALRARITRSYRLRGCGDATRRIFSRSCPDRKDVLRRSFSSSRWRAQTRSDAFRHGTRAQARGCSEVCELDNMEPHQNRGRSETDFSIDKYGDETTEKEEGDEQLLAEYGLLMTLFLAGVAGLTTAANAQQLLPRKFGLLDLALLGIATHKLSRLVA